MSARKINNWWWVDFRVNGERHRKRSPENSHAGAKAFEEVLRGKVARGEAIDRDKDKEVTFNAFAKDWFETYVRTNNKPSEQRNKEMTLRVHLNPWFGHLRLEAITARLIEEYKSSKLKSGLSPKTVNNTLMILRKCLGSAHEWELLGRVPKVQMLRTFSRRVDFLSEEEIEKLLLDAEEPLWNGMVLLAVHTGMRMGELFALEWSAVDLTRRVIHVRQSDFRGFVTSPKGNRERHIPMTVAVYDFLRTNHRSSGRVLSLADGRTLNHNMAACALKRLRKRRSVRPFTWHTLRHTFASHLVMRGVPIRAVQELLGHSNILMTERYAHLASSSLTAAVAVLPSASHVRGQPVGNDYKPWPETRPIAGVQEKILAKSGEQRLVAV